MTLMNEGGKRRRAAARCHWLRRATWNNATPEAEKKEPSRSDLRWRLSPDHLWHGEAQPANPLVDGWPALESQFFVGKNRVAVA